MADIKEIIDFTDKYFSDYLSKIGFIVKYIETTHKDGYGFETNILINIHPSGRTMQSKLEQIKKNG